MDFLAAITPDALKELAYTYYYPKTQLKLNFKLNTKDPVVGAKEMAIEIVKIYISQDGRKLHIYYTYDSNDATLTGAVLNNEVIVPLKPAYDGFCISGGPIQDLGPHAAVDMPWTWWKNAAKDNTEHMPQEITLTPMYGPRGKKTEYGRKAEMLGAWKKAWSRHLMDVWGGRNGKYPNMQEKTTWAPAFSTGLKASAAKKAGCFLFTTFVKNKNNIDRTAAFESYAARGDGYKLRLKF